MLVYLDGRESTGRAPNENFARELMELFTLGVGHYGEPDVKAAAAALTGWRLTLRAEGATLVPARHDDRPQRYLGVDGVHDVPTVVAALAAQPALPTFIAGMVATELLGVADEETVGKLAATFTASGLRIDALVRATLEAGLAGASGKVVLGPVPWLVMAQRFTGASLGPGPRLLGLRAAGQLPMLPPNVAGWPGGPAWFASATVVGRANLAAAVAAATADGQPALEAAASGASGAGRRARPPRPRVRPGHGRRPRRRPHAPPAPGAGPHQPRGGARMTERSEVHVTVAGPLSEPFGRRRFLTLAGTGAVVVAVAGCRSGSSGTAPRGSSTTTAGAGSSRPLDRAGDLDAAAAAAARARPASGSSCSSS